MRIDNWKWLGLLLIAGAAPRLWAQTGGTEPAAESLLQTLEPVVEGLSGKYGWLTTVLLAVGSLRILIKPLMLALERALRSNPEKLERLQEFEAGPIYRTVALLLDLGASIKLPLVKPPAK